MTDTETVTYHALEELHRPTHWVRFSDYRLVTRSGERFIAPDPGESGLEVEIELPLEIFPRVVELDLEDEEAILDFVRTYGPLGALFDRGLDVSGAQRHYAFAELWELRRRLRGWDSSGEFVAEFRLGAGQMIALTACQQELESEDRFSAARLRKRWSPWAPWKPPASRYGAARFLAEGVNAGLSSIAPRLRLPHHDDPENPVPELGPPKTLFSLCALELYNHYVSERRIRRCQNVTCGQLFTMQEGRSMYGVHRTDLVKYHTPACARAQAQREYRQRLAKGKGPKRSGRKKGAK